jgi:nitronate monooxygenase
MRTDRTKALCTLLGIEQPIVQAPMAGLATPELVAAVSNAGGLGSLGAAYLPPLEIRALAGRVKALTPRPFAINLFARVPSPPRIDEGPLLAALAPFHQALGLDRPAVSGAWPDFDAQLEAVLEARPAVFSFTLGTVAAESVERFQRAGIRVIGTATHLDEATQLESLGVDAICTQGSEAGGHRGTFVGEAEDALVGTVALVPQVADAVRVPVLAAGGIMDGRGIRAALELGASGAQLGTAFLTCPETATTAGYKRAVTSGSTTLTRAFSGKLGRAVPNAFIEAFEKNPARLPYPTQHLATSALRRAAVRADDVRFMSLWCGQAGRLARALPAAELMRVLIDEMS